METRQTIDRREIEATWRKIQSKMHAEYVSPVARIGVSAPGTDVSIRKLYMKGVTAKAMLEAEQLEKKSRRLARGVGMVHLLMSEAIHLIDEIEDEVSFGFKTKYKFGYNIKKVNYFFDRFCEQMAPLISPEETKRFNDDFEAFDKNVRDFAHLEGWIETKDEDVEKSLHDRFINLHREITEVGKEYIAKVANGDKEKAERVKNELIRELKGFDYAD